MYNKLEALNITHFYWAANGPRLPPAEIMDNLLLWINHFKPTEFVPILWVNDMVYRAIKNTIAKSHEAIYSCDPLPPYILFSERKFTASKQETLQQFKTIVGDEFYKSLDNMCYWDLGFSEMGKNELRHERLHKLGIRVINFEQFCLAAKITTESAPVRRIFNVAEQIYRELNNLTLFANTKDPIVSILLYLFGGFYFDLDLRPQLPFFRSIRHIKQLIAAHGLSILNQYSWVTDENNPNLFSLRKLDRAHKTTVPAWIDDQLQDWGMQFSLNRYKQFVPPDAESQPYFVEELQKLQMAAPTLTARYTAEKANSLAKHFKTKPLTDPELQTFMGLYHTEPDDLSYKLQVLRAALSKSSIYSQGESFYHANLDRFEGMFFSCLMSVIPQLFPGSPPRGRHPRRTPNLEYQYAYAAFYRRELLDRFTPVYTHTPSSLTYLGYQDLEKRCRTVNTVSDHSVLRLFFRRQLKKSDAKVTLTNNQDKRHFILANIQDARVDKIMLRRAIALVDATVLLLQQDQFPITASIKLVTAPDTIFAIIHEACNLYEISSHAINLTQYEQLLQSYVPLFCGINSLQGVMPDNLLSVFYEIQSVLHAHYDLPAWKRYLQAHIEEINLVLNSLLEEEEIPMLRDFLFVTTHIETKIDFPMIYPDPNIDSEDYLKHVKSCLDKHYNFTALSRYCSYSLADVEAKLCSE